MLQEQLADRPPTGLQGQNGAGYPGSSMAQPRPGQQNPGSQNPGSQGVAQSNPALQPRSTTQPPPSGMPPSGMPPSGMPPSGMPFASIPIPVPALAYGQFGARPGHSAIAQLPERSGAPPTQDVPARPQGDEEFVKSLLTHPDSVELDLPTGPARDTRQSNARPQADPSRSNSPSRDASSGNGAFGNGPPARNDAATPGSANSNQINADATPLQAEPEFPAREAEKPFESTPDGRIAAPSVNDDSDLTALPLTTRTTPASPTASVPVIEQRDVTADRPGPSLAMEAVSSLQSSSLLSTDPSTGTLPVIGGPQSIRIPDAPAQRTIEDTPRPTPAIVQPRRAAVPVVQNPALADSSQRNEIEFDRLVEDSINASAGPSNSQFNTASDSQFEITASNNESRLLAGRSQIVAAEPFQWEWPMIVVCLFAGIGLLFAAVMFLSMKQPLPPSADDEAPAPTPRENRRELDRLINNELPFEEEAVEMPHQTQHFGRAVSKQSRRIDAAHDRAPKKPHFLRRRDEGETQIKTPQAPEDPTSSGAGSGSSKRSDRDRTGTRRGRDGSTGSNREKTPMRPAASTPVIVGASGSSSAIGSGSASGLDSSEAAHSVAGSGRSTTHTRAASQSSMKDAAASHDDLSSATRSSAAGTSATRSSATRSSTTRSSATGTSATGTSATGRQFRIDPGHETTQSAPARSRHSASIATSQHAVTSSQHTAKTGRPVLNRDAASSVPGSDVAVAPAPSVADGSDLLDRILSSVQREKR